jgi:hypothetical protein
MVKRQGRKKGETMADTKEAIEARRAARASAIEAKQSEQEIVDLLALEKLEEQHGVGQLAQVRMNFYADGLPTFAVARVPSRTEFKRYQDKAGEKRPNAAVDATDVLATQCRVYPDAETYEKMREAAPGIHVQLGVAAVNLGAGTVVAEGKE